MATVSWADTSTRSLASAADALGKLSTQLGIPPRALWTRIPGVSKTDAAEWTRIAEEDDALGQLANVLDRQSTPPTP